MLGRLRIVIPRYPPIGCFDMQLINCQGSLFGDNGEKAVPKHTVIAIPRLCGALRQDKQLFTLQFIDNKVGIEPCR